MGTSSKKKGTGSNPPAQKKARSRAPSASNPSTSTTAKPQGKEGSRPASPSPAQDPPPLQHSFAEAAAGTRTQQQRASSPIIDVDMEGSGDGSPSGTAAPKNTTTTADTSQTQADQSAVGQKASSGPKGTKRKLAIPKYVLGKSLFQVKEWESYQRPPPKVPHQFVAFASLKDSSFTAHDVIVAGAKRFGKDLVAADVFTASRQVALSFPTAAVADAAVNSGLPMDEESRLPLTRRADYQPSLRRLTVSNVDCTSPSAAVKALRAYFKTYGQVLDVAPRYWADTHGTLACGT